MHGNCFLSTWVYFYFKLSVEATVDDGRGPSSSFYKPSGADDVGLGVSSSHHKYCCHPIIVSPPPRHPPVPLLPPPSPAQSNGAHNLQVKVRKRSSTTSTTTACINSSSIIIRPRLPRQNAKQHDTQGNRWAGARTRLVCCSNVVRLRHLARGFWVVPLSPSYRLANLEVMVQHSAAPNLAQRHERRVVGADAAHAGVQAAATGFDLACL